MKIIPTSERKYSVNELTTIANSIVKDFNEMQNQELENKYADFSFPKALLNFKCGDLQATLLHYLAVVSDAKHMAIELMMFFTHYGLDLDAKDKYGNTPLIHTMMDEGRITFSARVLLEMGADVNAANLKGKTVLYYVLKKVTNEGDLDGAKPLISKFNAIITKKILERFKPDTHPWFRSLMEYTSNDFEDKLKAAKAAKKGLQLCGHFRGTDEKPCIFITDPSSSYALSR